MKVSIRDADALRAVTPAAISAYARAAGWHKGEPYGSHSDMYGGRALPEILVPRTERLGDYASIVWTVIETFSQVLGQDELTTYRSLVVADRDVVRVRAGESDDGSVTLNDGLELIRGAHGMLLAAACSLSQPRPVYRAGANRDAVNLLKRVRLGQTEQSSFTVTVLTPVIPPMVKMLLPDPDDANAPLERRMTRRLAEALVTVREATERATGGDGEAFVDAVTQGVSANLCEALAQAVEPFPALDIRIAWARTRPRECPAAVIRFGRSDAPILREAARSLRESAPRPDVQLYGFARVLTRRESEDTGTIRLSTEIDGRKKSVVAVLAQRDYERAVQAHKDRSLLVLRGDLEHMGQRWRLLNPQIVSVFSHDGPECEG